MRKCERRISRSVLTRLMNTNSAAFGAIGRIASEIGDRRTCSRAVPERGAALSRSAPRADRESAARIGSSVVMSPSRSTQRSQRIGSFLHDVHP